MLELGYLHSPVGFDDEAADTPMPGIGVGLGEDGVGVGDTGVGDPVLGSRQDVVVAVANGPAAHGGDIAAGVGLREAVTALGLTGSHRREVLGLELFRPPIHDGDHAQLGDQYGHAGRGTGPGDLLDHDGLGDMVGSGPAKLGGDTESGKLQLHTGLEAVPRIGRLLVDGGGMGSDARLRHLAHGSPEILLGVGDGERLWFHTLSFASLPAGQVHRVLVAKDNGARLGATRNGHLVALRCSRRSRERSWGAASGIQWLTPVKTSKR